MDDKETKKEEFLATSLHAARTEMKTRQQTADETEDRDTDGSRDRNRVTVTMAVIGTHRHG